MIIDFSDLGIFCITCLISILLIMCSIKIKKCFPAFILLVAYMFVLLTTAYAEYDFYNRTFHFIVNYAGIIVSIVPYILVNDIETRRKFVTKVFKNRYKKK